MLSNYMHCIIYYCHLVPNQFAFLALSIYIGCATTSSYGYTFSTETDASEHAARRWQAAAALLLEDITANIGAVEEARGRC
jgi:hypothetical protein